MNDIYKQCHDAATGFVRHYFTDVTKHDKECLAGYSGDIIYAMRDTGTNLILLDGSELTRQSVDALEVFTFKPNTVFYVSLNGKLSRCTKARAWARWTRYRDAIGAPRVHSDAP